MMELRAQKCSGPASQSRQCPGFPEPFLEWVRGIPRRRERRGRCAAAPCKSIPPCRRSARAAEKAEHGGHSRIHLGEAFHSPLPKPFGSTVTETLMRGCFISLILLHPPPLRF